MPINRTPHNVPNTETPANLQHINDALNGENEARNYLVDRTVGDVTANNLTLGAESGSGSAGDRSLIFEVTNTISKILKWDQAAGWMKLVNQAGGLLPLALADPTDNSHAVTLNYYIANKSLPKGYINGKAPSYTSAATVTFPAGLKARNSGNTADIELAANVVVTLASTWTVGTPGLDAGSEASGTWYYYYLIKRPDTGVTSVIVSTVNESASGSITLPANYTQKRQLPLAVRNDGSSNIIPFFIGYGWPYRPYIWYDVRQSSNVDGTLGPCNVLDNGTATSWTAISLASCVPPISRFAKLKMEITDGGGSTVSIRKTGATHEGNTIAIATGGQHGDNTDDWETNASQQVDYITTSTPNNLDINVIGYTVTEVA
jgi:hypothetical protein